jgi:hypothetical protein
MRTGSPRLGVSGRGRPQRGNLLPPPALPNRSCSFPASGSQWV